MFEAQGLRGSGQPTAQEGRRRGAERYTEGAENHVLVAVFSIVLVVFDDVRVEVDVGEIHSRPPQGIYPSAPLLL